VQVCKGRKATDVQVTVNKGAAKQARADDHEGEGAEAFLHRLDSSL